MRMGILTSLIALSVVSSTPVQPVANPFMATPADINLDSIRSIKCNNLSGSGFLIADGVLATAYHVGSGDHCKDAKTGTPLVPYKEDPAHDFMLMTGTGLPVDLPYMKYSCSRFMTGMPYMSYGITGAKGMIGEWPHSFLRMNTLIATEKYTPKEFNVEGKGSSPGMRIMNNPIEFGMSGGPTTSLTGYAFAVNNAGNGANTFLYELADTILCNPSVANSSELLGKHV